jgi:hypothetical protein
MHSAMNDAERIEQIKRVVDFLSGRIAELRATVDRLELQASGHNPVCKHCKDRNKTNKRASVASSAASQTVVSEANAILNSVILTSDDFINKQRAAREGTKPKCVVPPPGQDSRPG